MNVYATKDSLSKRIVTIMGVVFGLMILAAMVNVSMLVSITYGPLVIATAFIFITYELFSKERYQLVLKQILIYAACLWGFTGNRDFSLHNDMYLIVLVPLSVLYLIYSIYTYKKKF